MLLHYWSVRKGQGFGTRSTREFEGLTWISVLVEMYALKYELCISFPSESAPLLVSYTVVLNLFGCKAPLVRIKTPLIGLHAPCGK